MNQRWMSVTLWLAGLYNLAWGTAVVLFPQQTLALFHYPPQELPQLWQCIGMIVGVYGVGYAIAASDPARHWPIVLVGFLGKVFGPIGFVLGAVRGQLPWSAGWVNVSNDLVWWIPFALILWHAWKSGTCPRQVATSAVSGAGGTERIEPSNADLTRVDHFAISVSNVAQAVDWYRERFQCQVAYQDETWALLRFRNLSLAFVIPEQHPPHLGFDHPRAADFGPLKTHRDGTRSCYITDPSGNAVELMGPPAARPSK